MKIWEILKEENIGKTYKCLNDNIIYEIYDSIGGLNMRKYKSSMDVINFKISNFMNLDFEPMQQFTPVTFDDVLKSHNICQVKVEHDVLDKHEPLLSDNKFIDACLISLSNKEWMEFNDLMLALSWSFSNITLYEIIKEGQWYLKEY